MFFNYLFFLFECCIEAIHVNLSDLFIFGTVSVSAMLSTVGRFACLIVRLHNPKGSIAPLIFVLP